MGPHSQDLRVSSCTALFNFKSQQDAAEVLQFDIDELQGASVEASDLISNQCFCFSTKEEKLNILKVSLFPNINSSFSKFLTPEILDSDNKWFCPSCNCLTQSTRKTSIISYGSVIAIQPSQISTSHSIFHFTDLELKVLISVEDEVSFSTKYY